VHRFRFLLILGALLASPSCKFTQRLVELDFYDAPESRLENLERLHTPGTGHHYSARFVGDVEHAFSLGKGTVGGITIGSPGKGGGTEDRAPTALPNPAETCLELLAELLAFDSSDNPRLEALQVAWCARIIDQDPAHLSRERAVLGLGPIGRRLGIEGPVALPLDAPRADAKQTADLLADLLAVWRVRREGMLRGEEWDAALEALRATTFDLDGSRRVLVALAGVLGGVPEADPSHAELVELLEDFERRTIQFSLARALVGRPGPESRVRAAVVSACAEAGGSELVARFLSVLEQERGAGPERDALLVVRIFDTVAALGLPASFAELDEARYAVWRERWYEAMVGYAVEDLDGRVRVEAMKALCRTAGGPGSLREEEWEEWYYTRVEERRAREGLPPTLRATDELEGADT